MRRALPLTGRTPAGFFIRKAGERDAISLCELLNAIIRVGGTTALEETLTPPVFSHYFLAGERFLACFVAEDGDAARPAGFQALGSHPDLPDDWADIATFARMHPKTRGVGTALFTRTRKKVQELGLAAINATIRADNCAGLAYYDKMGFQTYRVVKRLPLRDGTPIDRICKRYLVR